jgi:hypothetical protein
MTLFALLNFQYVMAYLFVGLLFMVVFGVALGFTHFRSPGDKRRSEEIVARYAEGITGRNAPFPLVMVLLIVGVVVWGFLYILLHGVLGVKI